LDVGKGVEKILVVGAGTMGHGIAEVAAIAGYSVVIVDVSKEILDRALERIMWSLSKLRERGAVKEDIQTIMLRIKTSTSLEDSVRDIDFAIEAVPENIDLKRQVFSTLDRYAPSHAVLATNTSSLPIGEIASATKRPDRVIGMHFFNPPPLMPLVEIVMGPNTSEEALRITSEIARRMGKEIVIVRKDIPGFIVNRLLSRVIEQACYMVEEEGVSFRAIDSALRYRAGLPMGVFELLDFTGIDVVASIFSEMGRRGFKARLCRSIAERYEKKELGMKSGKGFYIYPSPGTYARPAIPREDGERIDIISIFAPAVNEAAYLLEDGIVDSPEVIDKAVKLGLGYPRGLLEMADEWGIDSIVERLRTISSRESMSHHRPKELLLRMVSENRVGVRSGRGFYTYTGVEEKRLKTLIIRFENRIGWIVLNRPEKLNAISPEMLEELSRALSELETRDDVRVIVITGSGRAFSAGADVTAFTAANPVNAYIYSRRFQEVLNMIERTPKPVIASINGYALGGGLELALACDIRIASENTVLGQPEINLGLIPGAGGTQRLTRLVGRGKAKELIMLGEPIPAREAERIGLVNRVVPQNQLESETRSLASKLAEKPPIAIMMAKAAVNLGSEAPIYSSLALEASLFSLLFSTEDLIEGVSAFLQKRRPEFKGR
jgi:enoyl-CoA hydratase/3-hydroxyacyl-CoA dehydrogenase